MDKTSFYYKRKNCKFSINELENLMDVIKVDDIEDEVLSNMSKESEQKGDYVALRESSIV